MQIHSMSKLNVNYHCHAQVKKYATEKLWEQLAEIDLLLEGTPWDPTNFLKHVGNVEQMEVKIEMLKKSLPSDVDVGLMVARYPCFLDVPSKTILKEFPKVHVLPSTFCVPLHQMRVF